MVRVIVLSILVLSPVFSNCMKRKKSGLLYANNSKKAKNVVVVVIGTAIVEGKKIIITQDDNNYSSNCLRCSFSGNNVGSLRIAKSIVCSHSCKSSLYETNNKQDPTAAITCPLSVNQFKWLCTYVDCGVDCDKSFLEQSKESLFKDARKHLDNDHGLSPKLIKFLCDGFKIKTLSKKAINKNLISLGLVKRNGTFTDEVTIIE